MGRNSGTFAASIAMNYRVSVRRSAERDIADAQDWYEQHKWAYLMRSIKNLQLLLKLFQKLHSFILSFIEIYTGRFCTVFPI